STTNDATCHSLTYALTLTDPARLRLGASAARRPAARTNRLRTLLAENAPLSACQSAAVANDCFPSRKRKLASACARTARSALLKRRHCSKSSHGRIDR